MTQIAILRGLGLSFVTLLLANGAANAQTAANPAPISAPIATNGALSPAVPTHWEEADHTRLAACLARSENDAEGAYEEGMAWRAEGGRLDADHCVAVALIARGEIDRGANLLVALANASDGGAVELRALLLSKAANAWMLEDATQQALPALDQAIGFMPNARELYVDRAIARLMDEQWSGAEADITNAIGLGDGTALNYRLRAEARLQQASLDGADQDVAKAFEIAPEDIDNFVVRGRVREARRLGHAPH